MRQHVKKYALLGLLVLAVAAFFYSGLHRDLTLEQIKARQVDMQAFYALNPYLSLGAYGLIYVLTTALSLPGATVLTLAGAAFFGFWPALLVASFLPYNLMFF